MSASTSARLRNVASLLLALVLAGLLLRRALGLALERTITDGDELWHLATGQLIVESGHVPDRDPFTFTAGDTPWVNANWLGQTILYALYRRGGIELDWLLGLALLFGATSLATVRARVHVHARAPDTSAWAVLPVPFFVLEALATGSTVRPQGWSFLLLALALLLIDRIVDPPEERSRVRHALALGIVVALAAQMHGGWFLVAFTVATALGVSVVGDALRPSRRAALLALALVVGLGGALAHPQGPTALVHPFRYIAAPELQLMVRTTQELASASIDGSWIARLIEVPLLAILAAALTGRVRIATRDALLVAAFFLVTLRSVRGLHYEAVVVAAPLALALGAALEQGPGMLQGLLRRLEPGARAFVRLVPAVFAVALLVTAVARAKRFEAGRPGDLAAPLLAYHEPVAQVAAFLETVPGRAWNEMELGGALAWRFQGRRRTFIDGRGDFHALTGAYEEQDRITRAAPGFEEILARRELDLAVVSFRVEPSGRGRDGALIERAWRHELALAGLGWWCALETPLRNDRGLKVLVRPGSKTDQLLRARGHR